MCIVHQVGPAQVNLRAASRAAWPSASARRRRPSPRQGGQRPKLQQTKLSTRAGAAELVILEYGNMMRRIVDTECRQVCELRHTHTNSAQRGGLKSAQARPGAIEMEGGEVPPPPSLLPPPTCPSAQRRRPSPRQGGGLSGSAPNCSKQVSLRAQAPLRWRFPSTAT